MIKEKGGGQLLLWLLQQIESSSATHAITCILKSTNAAAKRTHKYVFVYKVERYLEEISEFIPNIKHMLQY